MRILLLAAGILGGVLPATAQPAAQSAVQSAAQPVARSITQSITRSITRPDTRPADRATEPLEEGREPAEAVPADETLVDPYSETVVVTASISEVEADRVPASVEVLLAEEIEARQATSVAELLATMTGLTVARSGSPGQNTSLFARGTESDHTLVLWNGVELNNPYFGGFNWAFQPTEGLARLEVARGPFSALYGSDAVGGVVQMISGRRDGVDLRLEASGNGYARTALEVGLGGERARLDLAGHVRRGDGELDNDHYDSDELVARLDWEFGVGGRIGLLARANDSETGIPRSGGLPSPERRIVWEERQLALPVRFERDAWRIEALLAAVEYDNRFSDPQDTFGFTAARTESRSVRARAAATRRGTAGGWLAVGLETETLEVDDRSVFGVNLDGAEQRTDALFGQWHREAGRWVVDVGVRYDDNDVYGAETSPRVAVSREVGSNGRLFASYGESFRAPSIGELFFPFSGNPDLRPEVGASFELGYTFARDRWSCRLTGFDNRLTDLIDFDFVTFTNVNLGEAHTRGVELAVGYAAPRWSMRWNGTYLDTEDRASGLELLRRPSETSSLTLGWTPDRWRLAAVARYVGERADVDPLTFARTPHPSHAVLDVAARWHGTTRWRWAGRLAPYARVENLLDREYEEVLGFPAPDQTWIVGVALTYGQPEGPPEGQREGQPEGHSEEE